MGIQDSVLGIANKIRRLSVPLRVKVTRVADRNPSADLWFPTDPLEFTGVRRHYVFGLRSQLPVPEEGWTAVQHPAECGAPQLTCEGLECPRALAASFWVTPSTDLQLAQTMADMFEAARAVARLSPHGSLEGLPSEVPYLRTLVSVSAPCEGESPGSHLEQCFQYMVKMARALLQATEQLAPPLSRQQLVPAYVVVDQDPDGARRIVGPVMIDDIYLGPSPATREQADRAVNFLFARLTKNPVELHHDLRLAAHRAVHAEGDYIGAVLKAAAASETLVKQVSWHISWEAAEKLSADPAPAAMGGGGLFDAKPSQLIGKVLSVRLGGNWDSSRPTSPVGAWRQNVAQLRNRIIHLGHRPTEKNAFGSIEGLAALELHLMDRLAARSNVYPRAALMLVGKEGLERRGRFGPARATWQHQSLQTLLNEYRAWVAVRSDEVLDD